MKKQELLEMRKPVHPKCRGEGFDEATTKMFMKAPRCSRIEPVDVMDGENTTKSYIDAGCLCTTYVDPSCWWSHPKKRCPMADHYRPDLEVKTAKGRVGQQKQKKKTRKK